MSEFDGFATHWPQVWSERLDESFRILSLSRIIMQDGEFHAFGVTNATGAKQLKNLRECSLTQFNGCAIFK